MANYDYDLLVIGAGSGGVRAARLTAQLGKRVAVIEGSDLGGTCVNVGCVPKKLLVYASAFAEGFTDSRGFGFSPGQIPFDWQTLITNKNDEINRLNDIYERILENAGVQIIQGWAKFISPHEIQVGDQTLSAERILIAVGGKPFVPEFPGSDLAITSNEAFYLEDLPKRVVIVGGGYIAVEFAGIFNGLDSQVTQLYRGDLFLRGFDHELREKLAENMKSRNIDLRFNTDVRSIEKSADGLVITTQDDQTIVADLVMYATGRIANTQSLALDQAGVNVGKRGEIPVDLYSKTNVDHIFAVGDVTNRMNLTPVAIAESIALVKTLYEDNPTAMQYGNIPSTVFSQPNLGTVGLTEEQARDAHDNIEVYRSSFRPMRNILAGRDEKVFMKLIVDADSRKVIGTHMLGPDAGEIIQGIAIAMQAGATKEHFDATIGIHPTTAEEFVTMRTAG